jgi:hypothetical protein
VERAKKTFKEIEEPKRDILFKSKARIKRQKDSREPNWNSGTNQAQIRAILTLKLIKACIFVYKVNLKFIGSKEFVFNPNLVSIFLKFFPHHDRNFDVQMEKHNK